MIISFIKVKKLSNLPRPWWKGNGPLSKARVELWLTTWETIYKASGIKWATKKSEVMIQQ